MSNGKGDDPRNCHTDAFRDGYDGINWHKKPKLTIPKLEDISDTATSDENAKQIQECEVFINHVSKILNRRQS